jgi:PAS domain S-box-containing protein
MTRNPMKTEPKPSEMGILVLMLLAIFTTELAVMEFLKSLDSQLGRVSASLVDATLLVLLLAFPLWIFVIRPLRAGNTTASQDFRSVPTGPYVTILAGIFLVEFLANIILPEIIPQKTYQIQSVIDAGLTILFSTPFLWWLLRRLELRRRGVSLAVMLGPPLRLYVLLLLTIFLVDMLKEQLNFIISNTVSSFPAKLVDAFVSTLLIAPLLWMLVVSPFKKAAQSEATRNRALHDQLIDAIVIIDTQGLIKNINPAAERIFCTPVSQLIGQPLALLFKDKQNIMEELLRVAIEHTSDPSPHIVSRSFGNCQDGSTLYMDVTISRVEVDGKEEFLLLLRDLTARTLMQDALTESEGRFRQIFEQSKDAIVLFSPATLTILDANVTSENLFGYPREHLKESGLECLGTQADMARLSRAMRSTHQDRSFHQEEIAMMSKDGTQIFVSLHCTLMTLQGNDVLFCTFQDTTDQARLRRKSQDMQAQLIQANKMTSLGLLVSGVAHEINNPNNLILTSSMLLAETWQDVRKILREYHVLHGEYFLGDMPYSELDAQSSNLFLGIIEGSRRINEIVNNLKGFARQDRLVMMENLDVNRVATAAVSILLHEINKFTDNFHLELAERIPDVKGNSQQLGQVIINLLMNACQSLSTRESGIWLTTSFDAASNQVTIAVRDEGSGVSPDDLGRIMEPFYSTKLDQGGTGLGLSISRSIVTNHHGSLEFVTEMGKGTLFSVHIPAGEPAAQE